MFYLKNKKDRTVVNIEIYFDQRCNGDKFVEVACKINIKEYSDLLLSNIKKRKKTIDDFGLLDEIRGWLWERHFINGENYGSETQMSDAKDKLIIVLTKIAKDYKLNLILE
jgi:hypothetical protein